MDASKVMVGKKTYDLNYLSRSKKTNLRRKLVIEYIQSKPAGEYIKMDDFKDICRFSTYANTWAFVQRMIRDGVISQHEGEKKKSLLLRGHWRSSGEHTKTRTSASRNEKPRHKRFHRRYAKARRGIQHNNNQQRGGKMILQEAIKSVYGITAENVYVDLHGVIRPRKNPTPGLYI